VTGDAQFPLQGGVGLNVGEDRHIGDRFNEPGAEDRRGDAEDDVRIPAAAGEGFPAGRKSGGAMLQPRSLRPLMTNRSCTGRLRFAERCW